MKIGILSRSASLYSTSRLLEAAEARGHEVEVIDYLRCYIQVSVGKNRVFFHGKALDFDAIIPRVGVSNTFYGAAVVRQFELQTSVVLNSADAITRSRDKLHALQILANHDVGLPATGFAHSPEDIGEVITTPACKYPTSCEGSILNVGG